MRVVGPIPIAYKEPIISPIMKYKVLLLYFLSAILIKPIDKVRPINIPSPRQIIPGSRERLKCNHSFIPVIVGA